MLFSKVADTFQKIEQITGRLEITQHLAALLGHATPEEASIICNLSLGLLHPPYVGTQFQMASKNLMPVVAQLLGISSAQAERKIKEAGDVGLVIAAHERMVNDRLTLKQVYELLSELEQTTGTGSQERKTQMLAEVLSQLDPSAAKFVVRIVTGKLRLGFSDMTLIDALSWMEEGDKSLRAPIEHAYNICADIGLIAQRLKEDGVRSLAAMDVMLGVPIRPAAAERLATARDIVEKLGPCIAQPKLDGFRLQIHLDKRKKQPAIHFFSRNLQDMSAMFPDLTKAVANMPVETVICEGEAICFDPNTGSFLPFQETAKRKRKHDIEQVMEELPLKVYLFDLLYLNGVTMLDKTHAERRAALEKICAADDETDVHCIQEQKIDTAQDLETYFVSNVAAGLEGVVVKREDAVYTPGKRNFNWIKLKRQEEGHLDDTLDCVILGYYAGKGKRAKLGIGAFLVGVYNSVEDQFQTIARIGTGLTDQEWIELKERCDAQVATAQPHNVRCAKELAPDVWVAPTIVCLVRADEITLSPVHAAGKTDDNLGFALRFPRVMGYRIDKSATDATEVAEVRRLYGLQYGKKNKSE